MSSTAFWQSHGYQYQAWATFNQKRDRGMQLWADRERQLLPHAGLLTHTVHRIVRCFNHRDYAERPDCHGYRGRLITMRHILSGKRRVFAVTANGPEDEHARGNWAALAD